MGTFACLRSCLALSVALICVATGCGDDGGQHNGGGSHTQLKAKLGLDLTHIIGFAVADSGMPRLVPAAGDAGTCNPSTLYAVDDSGALTVTTVTETVADGDVDAGTTCNTSMTTERATNVFDTPKYVVIDYFPFQIGGGDAGTTTCGAVILRKSDGALYCLPDSAASVKADATGDNLLSAGGMSEAATLLTRLNMTTMPPTATPVIDASLMVRFPLFDANSDGDALVPFSMAGPPSALRVYKANGGLQNVLAQGEECQWSDSHDFYYAYHDTTMATPPLDVYQLSRQGDGSFTPTKVGSMMKPFCRVALITSTQTYSWNWGSGGAPENEIFEMLGASAGTGHVVPGMTKIVDAVGVGTAIYVQGTDTTGNGIIVREDVPAFTATTLLPAGDFSLSAISVSKTGELTFAGLRNSDGARVVGNVAAGASTYTILSANAPMVTELQRIN